METKNKINHLFKFETRSGMNLPNGHTLTTSGGNWIPVIFRSDPIYSSDYVSKEVERFGQEMGFVKGDVCAFYLSYDRTVSDEEIPEIYSKWGNRNRTDYIIDFPEDGKLTQGFYSKDA